MVTESHVHASQTPHYIVLGVLVVITPILTYFAYHNKVTHSYLKKSLGYLKKQSHKGIQGRVIFVLFVVFMNLMFQNSTLPNLISGQLFGFKEGVLLTSVGCSLSGIVSFYIARYRFKDTINDLIDSHPSLKALKDSEDTFTTKDWLTLITLSRLPPVYPYHFISYFWGTTNANPFIYTIASYIGVLPAICVETYIGTTLSNLNDVFHMNKDGKKIVITVLVSILVTIFIGYEAKGMIDSHKKVLTSPDQSSAPPPE